MQTYFVHRYFLLFHVLIIMLLIPVIADAQPLSKDPINPHYLHYKGQPLLLITSAEHYGAVLNLDFDYHKYLETLYREGMNYTRIFISTYVEVPGSFGIENNSLSPQAGSFIAPWQRVDDPGLYENEGKFDFNTWNPDYFTRLTDFVQTADNYDIIVEVTFFCATYQDAYWIRHPFNPGNNVNDLGELARQDFNTLKNDRVNYYQKLLVEKITTELNMYDNIFYEISNEPWADNGVETTFLHKTLKPNNSLGWQIWSTSATPAALAWQDNVAKTFRSTEDGLSKKHLLAQNYSNFKENIPNVADNIDILNFHYAWPEAVTENYGWNRPIGFDESGFAGSEDTTYLSQAWAFMLSGGAIFNNLDYSFYSGREDGTGTNQAPGGGSTRLRQQLRFLSDFLNGFEFNKMKPSQQVIVHSPGMDGYCLAAAGQSYALYFQGRNQGKVHLDILPGEYDLQIHLPDDTKLSVEKQLTHLAGILEIEIPRKSRIAISLKSRQ